MNARYAWIVAMLLVGPVAAHDETRKTAAERRQNVERLALAQSDPTAANLPDAEACAVTLRTVDDATGKPLATLVRVTNVADGLAIRLPQEIHRASNWYSLDAESTLRLPRRKLRIEAVHGLETELAAQTIDLSDKSATAVELRLRRFYDAAQNNLWSGNTHLHLRGMSVAEMHRYLQLVPQTDGLDVVFVSHLRRAVEDRDYTSNILTTADLARLSTPHVQFGNGEEHRHNFGAGGQGYGHVMFLNIKQLIQPVSIGPGIMREGTDGRPLKEGIEAARADGATVIWCHNRFGLEDVPNWLAERLDAQNIHDGGQTHGSYDETYYRYLNIGLRVPFSTGTDWFVYDFSRVYVPMQNAKTPADWLRELAAGRSFITNGPLLEFSVDDYRIGDVIPLAEPKRVRIRARAVGRTNFHAMQIIRDGRILTAQGTQRVGDHYESVLNLETQIEGPSWLALRTDDTVIREVDPTNELGQAIFSHTSPIYIEMRGRKPFHLGEADKLRTELERALEIIPREGRFADDAERERVLSVYRAALRNLEARIQIAR